MKDKVYKETYIEDYEGNQICGVRIACKQERGITRKVVFDREDMEYPFDESYAIPWLHIEEDEIRIRWERINGS